MPGFLYNNFKSPSLQFIQIYYVMEKPVTLKKNDYPFVQAIKKIIGKLRQSPDIYPIRYYKKSRHFQRHSEGPVVK